MPDLRKRGPEGTLQRRVFVALQDHSGDATFIAAAVGHQRESTRKAISYLIDRGLARKHVIHPRLVFYSAVQRKHAPEDRRGKPARCRNHRGQHAYAKWLLMMKARHGALWRPRPKGHALDAWQPGGWHDRA